MHFICYKKNQMANNNNKTQDKYSGIWLYWSTEG